MTDDERMVDILEIFAEAAVRHRQDTVLWDRRRSREGENRVGFNANRGAYGKRARAKAAGMTDAKVREVRAWEGGFAAARERFGISKSTYYAIRNGTRYAWVPELPQKGAGSR